MKTLGQKLQNELFIPRLALALALLVVGGVVAFNLYGEHGRIEQRERERLATQAKVIDENLARQLDGVFLALESIRKELPLWTGKKGLEEANRHLTSMTDGMPGIRTIMITDTTGTITACNRPQVLGQNISYREYFQAPFKSRNVSTLHISPPFRTVLGKFVINVSLMIPGQKGGFAGVVSAALDPEYFSILLDSVLYAPDMWAALAHGDGKQFLMVPDREGMAGLDLAKPGSFFTRHQDSGLSANVLTGTVYATGDERLMALRTISPSSVPMDKPLVVAVGRSMPALYANWRREAIGKGALFAILLLSTTCALYFYQRRQQKFAATSARYLEELLHANESKSRLLATVAHEFRTPLSLLTSSTDILDRYGDRMSKEERSQQRDYIRKASRQMSALVDSVLTFNRLEGHGPPQVPVMVAIRHFCHNLAEEVKAVCCSGHTFSVTIDEACGTALLDETLFRRIVENLLTNAFRYTPAGGTVSLQVSRVHGRLRVVITDSGIGIPEADQKRIFEAFYRCRNVEARRGLGLGLSIVHEALLHMGGTITVESSPGTGTTMQVEIPIIDASGAKEQSACTQS